MKALLFSFVFLTLFSFSAKSQDAFLPESKVTDIIFRMKNPVYELSLKKQRITIMYDTKKSVFGFTIKKHGAYVEFDDAGKVLVYGVYRNDQKMGTWYYYDEETEVMKAGSPPK